MPLGMKVIANPAFKRVPQRFRERSDIIMGANLNTLVNAAAKAAQTEARMQLKDLVYTAPLPESAGPNYLTMNSGGYDGRRTGRVWNAIKVGRNVFDIATRRAAAEVRVDQTDFAAYYYAQILNYGGTNIDYTSRPYWSMTVRIMRARFRAMAGIQLKEMKKGFQGLSMVIDGAETTSGAGG